jgi:hypothetical protein
VIDSSGVSIFNLNGQVLLEKRMIISIGLNQQPLNFEGFEAGIYVIEVTPDHHINPFILKAIKL